MDKVYFAFSAEVRSDKGMKFSIPKRVYQGNERVKLTIRIPKQLLDELKVQATELGWNVTDLILTLTDQFVQDMKGQKRDK